MALSALETTSTRTRVPHPVCTQCGHPVDIRLRASWIETALEILATMALAIMLVPLGIMAWKSCTHFLSNSEMNSILYHPLEDWTQY